MLTLRTFTIQRLARPSGADSTSKKRSFQATGGMVSGFLETASPEFAAMVDGEFGRIYSLHSDDIDADVQIGDRLIDGESSKAYDVKGVLPSVDGPGRKLQITLALPIEQ